MPARPPFVREASPAFSPIDATRRIKTSAPCPPRCEAARRRGNGVRCPRASAYRRSAMSSASATATCGVSSTFSIVQSGWSAGSGSISNTSRPAPAISPSCQAPRSGHRAGRVITPADVDEVRGRLHAPEAVRVPHELGLRRVRHGGDHESRPPGSKSSRAGRRMDLRRAIALRPRIDADGPRSQRHAQSRRLRPDAADPVDEHRRPDDTVDVTVLAGALVPSGGGAAPPSSTGSPRESASMNIRMW